MHLIFENSVRELGERKIEIDPIKEGHNRDWEGVWCVTGFSPLMSPPSLYCEWSGGYCGTVHYICWVHKDQAKWRLVRKLYELELIAFIPLPLSFSIDMLVMDSSTSHWIINLMVHISYTRLLAFLYLYIFVWLGYIQILIHFQRNQVSEYPACTGYRCSPLWSIHAVYFVFYPSNGDSKVWYPDLCQKKWASWR